MKRSWQGRDGQYDRGKERGAALLLAMLAVLMAGLSLAVDALLVYGKRVRENRQTATVLAAAKQSLIAHAIMQGGAARSLPCPFAGSVDDYALSAGTSPCGGDDVAVIGLLPWTTLQRPPMWDSEKAPIWYAVSGHFKQGTTAAPLPPVCGAQTNGLMLGVTDDYAAILFAPGRALPGQTRLSAATPAIQDDFLDEENAVSTTDFVAKRRSGTFNDHVLGIRCSEIR
ncbi:MAG: hypothetical protein H7838_01515 [Magnetococcus sp. DMHC-8]